MFSFVSLWGWVSLKLFRPVFWLLVCLFFWFGLFSGFGWDGGVGFWPVMYVGWVGWDE